MLKDPSLGLSIRFVSYLHGSRDRRHATTQQGASGFAAHCLEQGAAKRWVGGGKHGDTGSFLVNMFLLRFALTKHVVLMDVFRHPQVINTVNTSRNKDGVGNLSKDF